ncbi:MAG: hypothetical protein ABI947_22525 [Chloroflexota bacterium]
MNIFNSKSARISTFVVLVILALGVPTLVSVLSKPTPTPDKLGASLITHRAFPSLSYGIHAFLWWNAATRSRDLERIRQMRFGYVKQIIDWNDVRADVNQPYNWEHMDLVVGETAYRGLKLVARLSKPPYWVIMPKNSDPNQPPFDTKAFGTWCHVLADRYKGKIVGYQVWNEPNLAREWENRPPNPAAYVKLLAACYEGIKSADPNALVISAPLAPTGNDDATAMSDERYLQGMYDAGLANYYDVLGLNAPGYKSPPETAPDDPSLDGHRFQVFRHVEDMRAIQVARGDGAKQVALLEVGWTVDTRDKVLQDGKLVDNPYRWHAVTEKQQADYLVGAYAYAAQYWRPWVGLMVTIYMPDPTWTENDEEYWWSIAHTGEQTYFRDAFYALADMAHYVDDTSEPALKPGTNNYSPLPAWQPTTPTAKP